MLSRFSGDAHPHLISLLATWEQRGDYYLLFHWAKCDLLQYWESQKDPPHMSNERICWVAKQCAGLTDGLRQIHHYTGQELKADGKKEAVYGRHGDIKPENVLWFVDPSGADGPLGRLVLSDFGFGEFNSRASASNIPNDRVGRTPTYRPPECDVNGGTISRSFDIWCLGCLCLEFVAWLLGGHDLISRFERSRMSPYKYGIEFRTMVFFDFALDRGREALIIKPAVTRVS